MLTTGDFMGGPGDDDDWFLLACVLLFVCYAVYGIWLLTQAG